MCCGRAEITTYRQVLQQGRNTERIRPLLIILCVLCGEVIF